MKYILLVFIAFLGCDAQIEMKLSNVYVLKGQDAEIPCSYTTDLSGETTIKWYAVKNNQNQQLFRVNPADPSQTIGSSNVFGREIFVSDNGTLTLFETTLADNKNFKTMECEVTIGQDNASARLNLTVIVLPSQPPVVRSSKMSYDAGVKKSVGTCKSGRGFPVPKIFFYKNSNAIGAQNKDDEKIKENNDEDDFFAEFTEDKLITELKDGTSTIKETLITNLTKEDNGAKFYCIVESGIPGTKITKRQNTTMPTFYVNYPTDEVRFVDPPTFVFAGTKLELTCSANGYPEPKIFINGKEKSKSTMQVDKADDGLVYNCSASNDKTMADDSFVSVTYTINVFYADDLIIEGPRNISYGASLSLSCISNSKPESPKMRWDKNGVTVSDTATLTISKANFSDAGQYRCFTFNPYEQLRRWKEVDVIVYGLMVAEENVIIEKADASSIVLVCGASAFPEPKFLWTRKTAGKDSKEEIVSGAEIKSMENSRYQSVLKLGPLTAELAESTYICKVTSGNSPPKRTTFELPESKQDSNDDDNKEAMAQNSSAGIIIGILVIIIIVAIVLAILYNKGIICGKKGDDGAEDAKDIQVKMSNDEESGAPENNGEAHQTEYKQHPEVNEETELMNGEQNS